MAVSRRLCEKISDGAKLDPALFVTQHSGRFLEIWFRDSPEGRPRRVGDISGELKLGTFSGLDKFGLDAEALRKMWETIIS